MRNGGNNVEIIGIKELLRKFENFQDEIKVEIQQELIATVITEIETPAKETLTQDRHVDSGRLRSSIYTKYKGHESKRYSDNDGNGFVCNLNVPVKDLQVSCGTDVPYAQKIEKLDSYLVKNYEKAKPKIKENINNVIHDLTRRYSG